MTEKELLKACPLLVQSDTNPSLTVSGQSWTRTYLLRCPGDECAAYQNGHCAKFDTDVKISNTKADDTDD
jgi:hypothetical protein